MHFHIVLNVVLKLLLCTTVPLGMSWICFGRKEEYKYLLNKAKGFGATALAKLKRKKSDEK